MRWRIWAPILALWLILSAVLYAWAVYHGVVLLNNPPREKYPVRGVDVSRYQGEIDWQTLAGEGIDFAFIKATEGSSYTDPCFEENFTNARATDLAVGAYHFFSFDSAGETQAENFIRTVPAFAGMLPPVIDLEFYGGYDQNPPPTDTVTAQLHTLLDMLEAHYGVRPILYATEESYALYLAHDFTPYDIWIRNVTSAPTLTDGRAWTFWQFTNRGILDGYRGEEKFIDLNVFAGTAEEFTAYPRCKEVGK
ncbi:MAG: glycoside hydrolase family 25 protein [Clostridia bacterium]|nr:glycoside hydrolase family 25 protein [Clostridia bacterium]